MKNIRMDFIGLVFLLFVISGCTSGYLDQETVNDAIKLGKEGKFNVSAYAIVEREVCGGKDYYCDEAGHITMSTPYRTIMSMAAIRAKEYKELTPDDLKLLNSDIVRFFVDSEKAEKAVIKYNIKDIGDKISYDVLQPTSIILDSPLIVFDFPHSKIKNQKIKLTLITFNEEKNVDIDMSKYK